MELQGRRALVTGGARRIGRAICLALAERGTRVAIHCNRSAGAARELQRLCPNSEVLQADLTDPSAPDALLAGCRDLLGGLDLLVNNASLYEKHPLESISLASWRRCMAVNLEAPFFLAQKAGLAMRAQGGGVIVNLTDWAVDRPYPAYLPYFAAKAGLAGATAGLARALAPAVRVNAIAPGAILPPEDSSPAYEADLVRATPLGRLGGAEAVVQAILFLIGNDFVTGETIRVDGGRSLR